MSAEDSPLLFDLPAGSKRKLSREEIIDRFWEFQRAYGVLTIPQAADYLETSTAAVKAAISRGRLQTADFNGRKFLSILEVRAYRRVRGTTGGGRGNRAAPLLAA